MSRIEQSFSSVSMTIATSESGRKNAARCFEHDVIAALARGCVIDFHDWIYRRHGIDEEPEPTFQLRLEAAAVFTRGYHHVGKDCFCRAQVRLTDIGWQTCVTPS